MKPDHKHKPTEGMLTQSAPVTSVNEESRTVDVVFSTGDLCRHWVKINDREQRMPTRVVLSKQAMDLEFLKASGPVLNSHSSYGAESVIGTVEDAWLQDGKAMARLRFSAAADVEPIWQRVREGVLRNVSMGFTTSKQEIRQEDGPDGAKIDVVYFTQWQPQEISVVAIPADKNSRTQSAEEIDQNTGSNAGGEAPVVNAAAGVENEQAAAVADISQNGVMTMADNQQNAAVQAADAETIRTQERTRIADIRQAGSKLGTDDALMQSAIDGGLSVDAFRAQAIEAFATKGQQATAGIGGASRAATIQMDERDKFRQGAVEGVMARAAMPGGKRNEFSGMTLAELARQSLSLSGVKASSDRREMIGQAFVQAGSHSTSDFANVLSNIAGKAALRGWEEAEETYQLWTRTGTLTDFKPTKRVGLGLLDALPVVPEGGDYSYGTVGDRGEQITLATYGRLLKITRQAIINDDLSLFSSLPTAMGRAARRTIGNLVYAVLTGNPTMSDGVALFHASHNNLGAAAAPSVASLGAGRTAMKTQREKTDGPALNIMPKYMIVPAALETTASQLLNSIVDPTASKGHASNPVAGMAQLISDGRLDAASATSWFLAADQNSHDTIEVAYLDGVQEPYIEEKTAWSSDGVELKVRIDAAVAPMDSRGLYKNAGA